MAELLRTTRDRKHWHLIYIENAEEPINSSEDRGHVHPVQVFPDPITNEPRISVGLAGENPHTHNIEPLENPLKAKPKAKSEEEVMDLALNLFKHADDIEKDSRNSGLESWKFFKGEHWADDIKQALNEKHRATQVYNYVQAFIDSLSGLARQNRLDPRAFPIETSDNGVADIVTSALVWISKRNGLSQEEIRVFEDMLIVGRGLFHIDISQRRNPMGDVILERFPWADGFFGEHNKLDASDSTHCHKAKWLSFQEAVARYPDLEEELTSQLIASEEYPDDATAVNEIYRKWRQYDQLIDRGHQRLRFIEHEIKETRTANYIMNTSGTLKQEVSAEAYRKAETIPGLVLADFAKDRIRVVVTVGTQLIRDYYPDRPYEGFSLVPVYAYKYDDNSFRGKVEAMKDPQREINKRSSQVIDIVNRMINEGWFYDDETFDSETELNKFKKNASRPGFTQKVRDTARPPVKPEKSPFPTELFSMQRQNVDILQNVTNIPPALLGGGTGYESGEALGIQRHSGLVGNERVFDNFILSKQTVFRKIFALIPGIYGPYRLARLTLSSASDPARLENLMVGGQEIPAERMPEQDQELLSHIMQLLSTQDLEEYDIAIGEQPMSATAKEGQFKLWLSAAQQGLPVPPSLLVDLSPLPQKGKWSRMMEQQVQQKRELEAQKTQAELAKAGRIPVGNNSGGNNQ